MDTVGVVPALLETAEAGAAFRLGSKGLAVFAPLTANAAPIMLPGAPLAVNVIT